MRGLHGEVFADHEAFGICPLPHLVLNTLDSDDLLVQHVTQLILHGRKRLLTVIRCGQTSGRMNQSQTQEQTGFHVHQTTVQLVVIGNGGVQECTDHERCL